MNHIYFDRDLSWLSFSQRIILEAARPEVPLGERISFLSIFSSNLDEFYRVRMPLLLALSHKDNTEAIALLEQTVGIIRQQQEQFGQVFHDLLSLLREQKIHLIYYEPIPPEISASARDYFYQHLLAFVQVIELGEKESGFFPENNKLYLAVNTTKKGHDKYFLVNIPSDSLPRFFSIAAEGIQYLVFIDDIIKENLGAIFPYAAISHRFSFKITRDAALELEDEFEGDLLQKMERLLTRRDMGLATRFLYEPNTATTLFEKVVEHFHLAHAGFMPGGSYHNLKDLSSLPVNNPGLFYPAWQPVTRRVAFPGSLLETIVREDILVHPPYHDYQLIFRFFNEAAIDPHVSEIRMTAYRIAPDSQIAAALISAAKNGKKVTIFVELKARFDEANNIRWVKKMKEAGVNVVYSLPYLKVHAKVALIRYKKKNSPRFLGLLSTGNFNERTARLYTDHILLTTRQTILQELESLFAFLEKKKSADHMRSSFDKLLVAPFNLLQRFEALIDREIGYAKAGMPAKITIKLNNLEEEKLIGKLYDASASGVEIQLLVRGICRLIPGIEGMSERISVRRIVDRYLEHGRVFWFHNNGDDEIYLGSADWMNRNIYRRIEVCFPVYDPGLKNELQTLLRLQWEDNVQAVAIDSGMNNVFIDHPPAGDKRSQEAIYQLIRGRQWNRSENQNPEI